MTILIAQIQNTATLRPKAAQFVEAMRQAILAMDPGAELSAREWDPRLNALRVDATLSSAPGEPAVRTFVASISRVEPGAIGFVTIEDDYGDVIFSVALELGKISGRTVVHPRAIETTWSIGR